MINIIKADGKVEFEALKNLKARSAEVDKKVNQIVEDILQDVKENGDSAVIKYTEKFDGKVPSQIEVSKEEITEAVNNADEKFVSALKNAIANIKDFHSRQIQQSYIDAKENGVIMGQRIRGLKRVGLYVPGGTAAYPSSVLMNAIPAVIAGVKEIIMVTPPTKEGKANPDILVAAALCGVHKIFLLGGAQAVGALAFGTETVPKVDKIVGPGNIFVATAKKILFGTVDIDMIAGPSEILVLADKNANPKFIASDLMGQAEHDVLASSILVTTCENVAKETIKQLEIQSETLSRKDIIRQSLKDYGTIIVCKTEEEAVNLANEIAPEHLEVMLENPMQYLGRLDNAGSIFLGEYAPEALGDYYAGPNHVLPTSGTARFFSPLSVDSFIKKTSYIYYTKEALEIAKEDIITIADKEGLSAHANSIKVRF
ncbi:MAG: histidinol dehydrogenase [Bacillota bacterium]